MDIRIKFLGAAGTVTGSCYLVTTHHSRFLVDCGQFQGGPESAENNAAPFDFQPSDNDFLILTHAHLDHCGLIAKLHKQGFRGAVHATPATCDLTRAILTNAAHIQVQDARKNDVQPLFGVEDARRSFQLFTAHEYDEKFAPAKGVTVRFRDAGHILGSAIAEVWLGERKVVFSGDIGNSPIPIMRDPSAITEADAVVCESTYGDRLHEPASQRTQRLLEAAVRAHDSGGKMIIPSFAMDRAQDLLYTFNQLSNSGELPPMPVYLDSPLASEITRIYEQYTGLFDEDFQQSLRDDSAPFAFPNFRETSDKRDSMRINPIKGPAIIIAGSGMADGGRVRFHLLHHLEEQETQVVFVGFQVPGTLGRELVDGSSVVDIMGRTVQVRAQIQNIEAFSSHADQAGLISWLGNFTSRPLVFLTHGEEAPREALAKRVQADLDFKTEIPEKGQEFRL